MKKLILVLVAITLLLTSCDYGKSNKFPKGKIKDSKYINKAAGIEFDGGDLWILTKEQSKYEIGIEDIDEDSDAVNAIWTLNDAIGIINDLPRKAFRGALEGKSDLFARYKSNKMEVWIEGKSAFKDIAVKTAEDFLYYQMSILLDSEFNEQMKYETSGVYPAEWETYSYSFVEWFNFVDHYYAKELDDYFVCIIITMPKETSVELKSITDRFTMS